jgi:hypothetical protein
MRQLYVWLTIGLLLCGVAAGAVGYVLLNSAHNVNVPAEVGKWLLTLAVALVVTGALSMVVHQIDVWRSRREAWHTVLNDLVAANQKVVVARVRLDALQSAGAYQEQLAEVTGARVELRRISALDFVTRDRSLRDQISAMRKYVDLLGMEYEAGYLRVARQQRLDEAWLDEAMTKAAQDAASAPAPELPDRLAEPTRAWLLLKDAARFPKFGALLDDDAYAIDAFRTNYKFAKDRLEVHAGFGKPSVKSVRADAQEFAEDATRFAASHADDLADVRELVEGDAEKVDDENGVALIERLGREIKAVKGRRGLHDAAVELSKVTANAVRRVYRAERDKRSAADELAGKTADIEAQPVAPSPP